MPIRIDNSDDLIDSRDVETRIDTLQDEREALADAVEQDEEAAAAGELDETAVDDARQALAEWDDENSTELSALLRLREDAEGIAPDWPYGATLIRDSYFKAHTMELAEDIHGDALRSASWPFDYIDWDRAADALKMDYTAVDFDGVTYWVQSALQLLETPAS